MQDYINLINFLKENDESVRKDLEELRFWCKVKIHWWDCKVIEFTWSNLKIWNWKRYLNYKYPDHIWWNSQNKSNLEIIWNNLDYHHIMMYCKHKNIWIIIDDDTINLYSKFWTLDLWNTLVKVDNTKPLNEQKSEVYNALLDYFISIK